MAMFWKRWFPTMATLLMCASCATVSRPPGFKAVLYSVHGLDGAQQAERSLEADGRVEGSHLSGGGAAPFLSMGSESARPEDLREIADLVGRLPEEVSNTRPGETGYLQLQVVLADGTVRTYRTPHRQPFADPLLQRLVVIMSSYRAGYW